MNQNLPRMYRLVMVRAMVTISASAYHQARALDSSPSAMSMPRNEGVVEWTTYSLSPTSEMKYYVNVPSGTNAEECTGCSVSVEVVHNGEAWLGIASSVKMAKW